MKVAPSAAFKVNGGIAFLLLFLLFCLLPSLVISELKDPTQSGKFLFFSFSTALLAVSYCFGLYKKKVLSFNLPDCLLLVLFVYITFNKYVLHDTGFSVRYIELLGLAVVYLFLRQYQGTALLMCFIAVITGGAIQAIYGMSQLHGFTASNHNLFDLTGGFFNPGPYAGYLASVFPVSLGVYFYRNVIKDGKETAFSSMPGIIVFRNVIPYLAFSGMAMMLLVLPASMSRAAWVAVFFSTAYLVFNRFNVRQYMGSRLRRGLTLTCLTLVCVALAIGIYVLKKDSSNGRLFIWKVTGQMIGNNAWFGYGLDGFRANYMDHQEQYFKAEPESKFSETADDVDAAFNEPLQFIAENGILGLGLMLLVLISFYDTKSTASPMAIIAKAGLIAVLVFSLFSYPSQILAIKLNAVLYIAVISALSINNKVITFEPAKYKGAAILIVAASLVFFYLSVSGINKLYKGYRDWSTAYTIYQQGMYGEAIGYYEKAYPVFSKDGKFLTQYGKALSMNGAHNKALSILGKAKRYFNTTIVQIAMGDSYKKLFRYREAEMAYLDACFMIPDRFYPKYLLVKLYIESKQKEKAFPIAKTLLTKKAKVPSEAVLQIQDEMRKFLNPTQ